MLLALPKGPFTVEQYYRLAGRGMLDPESRLELINGEIVRMSPIGPEHAGCVDELARLLIVRGGEAVQIRVQNPVAMGSHTEPQPDLAVARRRPGKFRSRHPEPADVLLIIEVADTSAAYDRDTKVSLYAQAGIPETWLVDLGAGRIEVYSEPASHGYAQVRTAEPGDALTPLLLPGVTLQVDQILGPQPPASTA